jgi:hypothetical protein
MQKSAVISPDGRYRYRLARQEPKASHKVLWLMLNPSTADAEQDDPTIRKCLGFTHRLGFKAMMVWNLAAIRATDPKDVWAAMRRGEDIFGPDNLRHLTEMVQEASVVIAAWGMHGERFHGSYTGHVDGILWGAGKQTFNLGRCANGQPRHPLMVGYDNGLLQMAVPPREFGCAPLEPQPVMVEQLMRKMAEIRGEQT